MSSKKPKNNGVETNPFLALGVTFMTTGVVFSAVQDMSFGATFFSVGVVFLILGITNKDEKDQKEK
jgi:uncharacterized membrane protein